MDRHTGPTRVSKYGVRPFEFKALDKDLRTVH